MLALLAAHVLVACGDRTAPPEPDAPARETPARVAESGEGVVVAAHPLAAAAGVRMLELGGNAADAAAAAAFALAVVEPTMSGLGGRVQVLLRRPGGDAYAIDGTTQAPWRFLGGSGSPASTSRSERGYSAVGVPGQVAGVLAMHTRHGRLTRADVLEPAIGYARDGFELLPGQAERLGGLRDEFLQSDGARLYFLRPDGSSHEAGDLLVQIDLANTLSTLADLGADAFYTGPIAEQIVSDMEFNGGLVSLDDLQRYEVRFGAPIAGSYRGHDLLATDRPAAGPAVIEALHILETFDIDVGEEAWASLLGQSLLLALEDRASPVPPEEENTSLVTSKAWAEMRARSVRPQRSISMSSNEESADPIGASWLEPPDAVRDVRGSHLSVADRDGMVVALTQSLGSSGGAAVATPGLGFLYATTLGGDPEPLQAGQRSQSSMSPFVVLRDGQVEWVLGAADGIRTISSIVQVTSRLIDHGLDLPGALDAPRFLPVRGGDGESEVPWVFEQVEGLAWDTAALAGMGIPGRFIRTAARFGRVHGIAYHGEDRTWQGVADPDWEGAADVPSGPTDTRVRTASIH